MTLPTGLQRALPVAAVALVGGGAGGIVPWWVTFLGVLLAVAGFFAAHVARRRGGRKLLISVARASVRRGEPVWVKLDLVEGVSAPEALEVGLVCRVRWAVREYQSSTRSTGHGGGYRRTTRRDTAYEAFKPATPGHPVDLTPPREQPYSHEGQELGFSWRVVARDVRSLRPDPTAEAPLLVLP